MNRLGPLLVRRSDRSARLDQQTRNRHRWFRETRHLVQRALRAHARPRGRPWYTPLHGAAVCGLPRMSRHSCRWASAHAGSMSSTEMWARLAGAIILTASMAAAAAVMMSARPSSASSMSLDRSRIGTL